MSEENAELLLLPRDVLIQKVVKDLYFGNGKPALTVRMALQEENMEQVQTDIGHIKTGQEKFNRLILTTMLSSIGGLIAIIAAIAVELIKGK